MYHMVAHEQDIPRLEAIVRALDHIVNAAGDEDDYLVKLVKMEVPLLPCRVTQVEHSEIFVQIPFPVVFISF